MERKVRNDLIPAANGVVRLEIISQARSRAATILIEEQLKSGHGVEKVFQEAQKLFWQKCLEIDQKHLL
ncbi:MAG TPA: hypothetical protein VKC54_03670 [Patescibacteria group bacterium]|nr:hypothetical protein [Patescibacteria group bacterium]